jgi:Glyoxalase/Bleomycin resistance protein/Dioxygenase superfamily
MALPKPNLYPPFNILRLSHVELAVTDLAKSRAFYVDILGLQVTDETADAIYLRAMEERGHHCIVLRKSDKAEACDLGFKVFSEEDLDKAEHFFAARNCLSNGWSGPINHGHCAPVIHMVFRWSSIPEWIACRRSTRNMRFIKVSSRCASIISTASRRMSMKALLSITKSGFALPNILKMPKPDVCGPRGRIARVVYTILRSPMAKGLVCIIPLSGFRRRSTSSICLM